MNSPPPDHAPITHQHAHRRAGLLALSAGQRFLLVSPILLLIWGLTFWAMQ